MARCVGRPFVLCHGHGHASLVLLVTAESTKQLEGNRFKNQGCKEKDLTLRDWRRCCFTQKNGLVLVTDMVCTQLECWATWAGCRYSGDGRGTLGSLSLHWGRRIHTAPGDADGGPASSLALSSNPIYLLK